MNNLIIIVSLACFAASGQAKPVEDTAVGPSSVEQGVATVVGIIDSLIDGADDVKTSEIEEKSRNLLTEVKELSDELTTLAREALIASEEDDEGTKETEDDDSSQNNLSLLASASLGYNEVFHLIFGKDPLDNDDAQLAVQLRSLRLIRDEFIRVTEHFDKGGDTEEILKDIRDLHALCSITEQVAKAIITTVQKAEMDVSWYMYETAVPVLERDAEQPEVDAKKRQIGNDVIERKRRNWGIRRDGLHWSRGNHDFSIGPTFGRGGFGGGATYTWRFK